MPFSLGTDVYDAAFLFVVAINVFVRKKIELTVFF